MVLKELHFSWLLGCCDVSKTKLALFVVTFIGLWGFVYWELRPYPKGSGTSSLSPDQRWTAVLIPVEHAGVRDALGHILDPRIKTLPTHPELKLHVVQGEWDSGEHPDLYNQSLPIRHCPQLPLNAKEIFHWRLDPYGLDIVLRGTNITLDLPKAP